MNKVYWRVRPGTILLSAIYADGSLKGVIEFCPQLFNNATFGYVLSGEIWLPLSDPSELRKGNWKEISLKATHGVVSLFREIPVNAF